MNISSFSPVYTSNKMSTSGQNVGAFHRSEKPPVGLPVTTFGNRKKGLMVGMVMLFATLLGLNSSAQSSGTKSNELFFPFSIENNQSDSTDHKTYVAPYRFSKFIKKLKKATEDGPITLAATNAVAQIFAKVDRGGREYINTNAFAADNISLDAFKLFTQLNQTDGNPTDIDGNPMLSKKDVLALHSVAFNNDDYLPSLVYGNMRSAGECLAVVYNRLFPHNPQACEKGVTFDTFAEAISVINNNGEVDSKKLSKTKQDDSVVQLFRALTLNDKGQELDTLKLYPNSFLKILAVIGDRFRTYDNGGLFDKDPVVVPNLYFRDAQNQNALYHFNDFKLVIRTII